MWKIFSKLFGWDYVAFVFGYGYKTRRIRYDARGDAYVTCYGYTIPVGEKGRGWRPMTHGAVSLLDALEDGDD